MVGKRENAETTENTTTNTMTKRKTLMSLCMCVGVVYGLMHVCARVKLHDFHFYCNSFFPFALVLHLFLKFTLFDLFFFFWKEENNKS